MHVVFITRSVRSATMKRDAWFKKKNSEEKVVRTSGEEFYTRMFDYRRQEVQEKSKVYGISGKLSNNWFVNLCNDIFVHLRTN